MTPQGPDPLPFEEAKPQPQPDDRMDSGLFDMEAAKRIQQALLPKAPPEIPGYKMGYYYAPRKSVGGDYCDFIEMDKKHLAVVVADVSGHGVAGALVAAQMRTFVRTEIERGTAPREVVMRLNKMIFESTPSQVYATMVYMVLEIKKSRISYINAGHPPLALRRWKSSQLELLSHQSVAIGVDAGPRFKAKLVEDRVDLAPGDVVVAYTDGITEATNPAGEQFGDRFRKLLLEHGARPWQELTWFILGELHGFTKKEKQDDDITLVSIRATPV